MQRGTRQLKTQVRMAGQRQGTNLKLLVKGSKDGLPLSDLQLSHLLLHGCHLSSHCIVLLPCIIQTPGMLPQHLHSTHLHSVHLYSMHLHSVHLHSIQLHSMHVHSMHAALNASALNACCTQCICTQCISTESICTQCIRTQCKVRTPRWCTGNACMPSSACLQQM